VVGPSDVAVVPWPAEVVPASAVRQPDEVIGRPVAATVPAEVPLVRGHVAADGPSTELPPGRVALPFPLPDGVGLLPGQRIDVLAADSAGGGVRLAAGAYVLSVDDTTAWISLARDEAPAVAGAVSWGQVRVALLPPGG
jgi:Flp pilus assembly protein CpaB